MKIEIISIDNEIQKNVLTSCKLLLPDLKIEENKSSDFKRLLKKLIRDRSIILKMNSVRLLITCPFFIYYDIRDLLPCHWYMNIVPVTVDEFSFESSDDFSSTDDAALACLFKKVKSVAKDIDPKKLKYFLPLSCHTKFYMFLDLLQVYEFLNRLSSGDITDEKMKEFRYTLMKILNDKDPVLFNEQLLEVYQATEEDR